LPKRRFATASTATSRAADNQRSELGAILDPLRTSCCWFRAIVLFSFNNPHLGSIPLWLTGTIIGRDLLVVIGMAVISNDAGAESDCAAKGIGKSATVLQTAVPGLDPPQIGYRAWPTLVFGLGDSHGAAWHRQFPEFSTCAMALTN